MTDISINSKKFDMSPGMRVLVGEYVKTIIIVIGKSGIGKSTICDKLLNDGINYISVDDVCIYSDHNIKEIKDFVEILRVGEDTDPKMSEQCCVEFMNYFFENYIRGNENLNILVDGYLLMLGNIYNSFLEKCKSSGYRVWKMERML
jgi:predicted ABC-type ATPase